MQAFHLPAFYRFNTIIRWDCLAYCWTMTPDKFCSFRNRFKDKSSFSFDSLNPFKSAAHRFIFTFKFRVYFLSFKKPPNEATRIWISFICAILNSWKTAACLFCSIIYAFKFVNEFPIEIILINFYWCWHISLRMLKDWVK